MRNILWSFIVLSFLSCDNQEKNVFTQGEFKEWALTPPMGWNSWDCYGPTVEEHEVKANADYMARHLKEYGWEYIVVDIRWFVENDKAGGYNQTDPRYVLDEYGRYTPATNRFPSAKDGNGFKDLADYVHSKGLKFGIHIMRGIPKVAVEQKLPIKGTNGITAAQIYSTENQCKWLKDNYTIIADSTGAQEYYNSIFELYAEWGIDFIKIDDLSAPIYHKDEVEMIRKAIDNCGRPIVLSTSPGATPLEAADHVSNNANMWRMVNDVWDTWSHIDHLMDVSEKWYPYIGPGTWPDCDMLPLGRISIRGERGEDRMTRLSKDEQYSMMSLWAIFRSPLMFGGDLPSNDDFTLSLLTNTEVLDILKYSTNNRLFLKNNGTRVWLADDTRNDDVYAALFYNADQTEVDKDKAIYSSPLISHKQGEQSIEVAVDIKGAKKLYLVVTDGGDGGHWDHADWIEPKLSGSGGGLALTDNSWVKATSGWENAQLNKSVAGNPLVVEGFKYDNGIGTHANSIIEYDLPEGYDTFTALAGLDEECISHTDGATVKFHVFTQNPFEIELLDSTEVDLTFKEMGLIGKQTVRDLWKKEDLGTFSNRASIRNVRTHSARLVKISKSE